MQDWFAWIWVVIASPFIGSHLGLLIRRLPAGAPLVFSRSLCEHCETPLATRDLIPVVSWLTAGGRCRYCRAKLGLFYPGIEIAAFVVAVWAALALPDPILILAACVLGWLLLGAAAIDSRHLVIPNILIVPLIPGGILFHLWITPDRWMAHVTGAVVGYVVFATTATVYRILRRRDGLGLGDATLLAAAGAWVGWAGLPSVVLLGAVLGLATALVLWMAGREVGRATELPFGPALAAAIWLVWLYGPLVPA